MAQLRNALRAYALEPHPPAAALERLNRLAWTLDRSVMATLDLPRLRSELRASCASPTPAICRRCRSNRTGPRCTWRRDARSRSGSGRRRPLQRGRVPARAGLDAPALHGRAGREAPRARSTTAWRTLRGASSTGARRPRGALRPRCSRRSGSARRGRRRPAGARADRRSRPERLQLTMPAEPLRCGSLRRALRRWLTHARRATTRATTSSSPATRRSQTRSSTRMVPGTGRSRWMRRSPGDEVSITVRDFGRWREPRGDNRGRGLTLIEAVMDSVSVVTERRGGNRGADGPKAREVARWRRLRS